MPIALRQPAPLLSKALVCLSFVLAGSAFAQDAVTSPAAATMRDSVRGVDTVSPNPRLCWRGRPRPRCDRFMITELGLLRRVVRPTQRIAYTGAPGQPPYYYTDQASKAVLAIELGQMKNISKRSALGASVSLGMETERLFEAEALQVGLRGRYRQWLTERGAALDFAAGIESRAVLGTYNGKRKLGLTSEVAISPSDYLALIARYDDVRYNSGSKPQFSIGVRTGGKAAPIGFAAMAVTFSAILGAVLLGGGFE